MNTLEILRLAGNDLSGEVLSDIGSLTGLTELALERNNFIGQLPTGISALNLDRLSIEENNLDRIAIDHNAYIAPALQTWFNNINITSRNNQ